ncbi:MAG: U32 family peptidase [Spirochaetia bacterium]|nr:U32 family peptidase [Spirochaetia bacterium]
MELLAPAGSLESLHAAVNAGCNSIYFGAHHLNMRARSSDNFDLTDIKEIIDFCHTHKVKAYLTINSLLYDHDIKLAHKTLEEAKTAGVDAVIAADTALILKAHEMKIPVHISTQLSVSNFETVKFWSKYADVIVLARELDLNMIKNITERISAENIIGPSGEKVKIEIFGHGALCIAISGRCSMSLYADNSSANRGACKQPCRRSYELVDSETGDKLEIDNEYILSPKDICVIGFLDKIKDAGISVLKIEGRGRSPDYVDVTIRCYKEAIQSLKDGFYTPEKINNWKTELQKVFNRGFFDGYYLGLNSAELSKAEGSVAKQKKIFVGKIQKYFSKAKAAQLFIEAAELPINSRILITGVTTGVLWEDLTELRNEERELINSGQKKTIVTLPVSSKVRPGDKLYLVVNEDLGAV